MITRTILQWQSLPVLLSISLVVLVNQCSGASLQYGDKCMTDYNSSSTENMCNTKESLSCQNGTCLCSDMTQMTYDPNLGLCVGLAGHECVHHPTEAHLPNFRKTHCVAYASCENKTCTCWSAFYQDETSHCSRRRGYLQQCRMDFQCDGRKGLICKDSLCQCNSATAAYNPELERCVGLPGESCINQYRECVENYKCKVGVCVCKFKEVAGKDGKLKCDAVAHKHGKNCGKGRGSCGSELVCINGKCKCPNPDYQVYDYEQRACVSLVGGPCTVLTPPSNSLQLEENIDPDSYIFKSGKKSVTPSNSRNGNKKKSKKNKNKKKKPQLFGIQPYSPNTFYRNTTATTPAPVIDTDEGAPIATTDASVDTENQKLIPCIPYARCLPYGPSQSLSAGIPEMGRCECDKGYIETKKGKCNLPYNAPCDTHSKNKKDICDESVPLYCVNSLCSCKNALDVFEEDTKRCKKSIGSLCWKDPSCVTNARCIRYSPRLPGRCMCPPNYHPDPNSSTCIALTYEEDPASNGYEEEDEDDIEEQK